MPSRHDTHFQPLLPLRTGSSSSQKSLSSGTASPDMLSPTTPTFSRGPLSSSSPTDESFFGAITSRIRGRSHSRSRSGASHKPAPPSSVMPPQELPAPSATQPTSPTYARQRPQQSRHVSTASQGSVASSSSKAKRPSMQGPARRSTSSSSGSDMWRGRHSNSWLFNDYSMTAHAKDILHIGRKS